MVYALAFLGGLYLPPQVRHAGAYGADRAEMGVYHTGDDIRQRGLAAAGRPPEDNRGNPPGFDCPPQHTPFAHQVLLADEFVQ